MGTCGIGNGADALYEALRKKAAGTGITVKKAGCFGYCAAEPLLMAYLPGKPILLYFDEHAARADKLIAMMSSEAAWESMAKGADAKISVWDFHTSRISFGDAWEKLPEWNELPFFKGQTKLILRDAGLIDPESLPEYLAVGGYTALEKALSGMSPEALIDAVTQSGLRGRGGAGFPTGVKWKLMRANAGETKYVICNADEGDPGAYMNRNEIESDPHMLVEGMALGAYAMGASQGFVYVRAEYPLAVERLAKAIADAEAAGLLGDRILGSDFSFHLDIVKGAGAFVCGEETALIASAEGRSGRPSPRPPFPAQKGYRGLPTNINNVETWCNVPVIVARGAKYYAGFGTAKSPGTKVFSLVGKARNTGLVELSLGTPLADMIYGMGGGAGPRKTVRAVQSGGPSGGCIAAADFGASVDYESLAAMGAIMGSGGMVVMDQDNCMVDVARYFISFTSAESCGKCAPCREGLAQMLRILTDITKGRAELSALDELERLARTVKDSALCGLGQTAANPILTTLKYFRDEYEEHILDKRCKAGVCEDLFSALCENSCPLHMNIPGYIALLAEDRIEDAFELTLRDNPLPGTVGRICHFHCQMRCRRDDIDEPVSQGEIHRYLADTMYKLGREKDSWKRLAAERLPDTGKRIAIVGAGPAGLTAAFYLRRLGHDVTVYEAQAKAGGILRYGIPAYRLPKEVLDKELELWKKLGVSFVFNARLGRDLTLDGLKAKHDALIVAIGAQGDKSLGIPGEDLEGVHPGYEWLERYERKEAPKPGKKVIVIGGGNVAIDAARTLFRENCDVTVAYRRAKEDLPANAAELQGAAEECVAFKYMLQPVEILGHEDGGGSKGRVRAVRFQVMKAGGIDPSGRPAPVATERFVELPCDDVYVAVGERVESAYLAKSGLPVRKDGRLAAAGAGGRLAPGFWAIGDAVSGPATAAEAMGLAKSAAKDIDAELMGRDVFAGLFKDFGYSMAMPEKQSRNRRGVAKLVPPEQRHGNFQEIAQGYSGEQARAEAARCLRCDLRDNALSPWR
jgi:NADH-quinone oxidoreductase subunit F